MSRRKEIDEVRDLIETRGVKAAAKALIEVCSDPKAPAPARATAGTALLRAAGMFEKVERDDNKDVAEMDGFELRRATARICAQLDELKKSPASASFADPSADDDEDDGGDDPLFE
ncbi:hypothetical protein [Xanthobacter autotrophicus]|uniref:hypothetical protein n=1 Tax=Xanthobacter autotrophicus TaxID=280 RepID=UPI00372A1158